MSKVFGRLFGKLLIFTSSKLTEILRSRAIVTLVFKIEKIIRHSYVGCTALRLRDIGIHKVTFSKNENNFIIHKEDFMKYDEISHELSN